MTKPIISAERLREVLEYFPETGLFVWRARTSRRIKIGDVAGCDNGDGYIVIKIDGRMYLAHRLAFFYVTGRWPAAEIDHRDGNPSNNRWDHLREATRGENQQNLRKANRNNKSGFLGVSLNAKTGLWNAFIEANGKKKNLGGHITAEAAHAAYVAAKRTLHRFGTL